MSESVVRSYSPDKILNLVNGVPTTGFGEDTFITITPATDLSSVRVGADGEIARSRSSNKVCTIEVTLLQTSLSNDYFSSIVELDEVSGGLLFPFMVQDLRGRTMFMASQAWISQRPPIVFGREAGDRTWQFTTGRPSIWLAGGNT